MSGNPLITSAKNPTIQQIRKLQSSSRARREAGLFVIEGKRLVTEALAAGLVPTGVLFTPGFDDPDLLTGLEKSGAGMTPTAENAMQAASDTRSPQGILAVMPWKPLPLPAKAGFYLVLDGLRDPGNMGTLIRTAAAAGVDGVLVGPESADPFAPKVLRGGMGGHFKIPVVSLDWEDIRSKTTGMGLFLADSAGGVPYTEADFTGPCAFIIGSEAHGPGAQAQQIAPTRIHIPMPGKMESLNAAVAGGIILFEIERQKRHSRETP